MVRDTCEGGISLKTAGSKLLRFGSEGVLKIFEEKHELINQSVNDDTVCRTALATLSLLNTVLVAIFIHCAMCDSIPNDL